MTIEDLEFLKDFTPVLKKHGKIGFVGAACEVVNSTQGRFSTFSMVMPGFDAALFGRLENRLSVIVDEEMGSQSVAREEGFLEDPNNG